MLSLLIVVYLVVSQPVIIPCTTDADCMVKNPQVETQEQYEYRMDQAEWQE